LAATPMFCGASDDCFDDPDRKRLRGQQLIVFAMIDAWP
jgi:hypothetical protein